jgi:membrane associated rhomboid family serine protease
VAFRSNGPVTVSLPPFRGVTRRIILTALVVFFVGLVLGLVLPGVFSLLFNLLVLEPAHALHGFIWQFVTYPFLSTGILSLLLALLSLWFFGSALETERGARWISELFFVCTIGGALIACLLYLIAAGHVWGVTMLAQASSLWPFVLSLLVAFAVLHPEEQLSFNFIFQVKAKYLAAIYLLIYLAVTISSAARFSALLALCNSLCAYLYLRVIPSRGLRFASSEKWFGWRNAYYRMKRRRAAKKFTVYMRKQGRDVTFDDKGRYTGEDDKKNSNRDPNDRSWMN